jgi:hypothetical protein
MRRPPDEVFRSEVATPTALQLSQHAHLSTPSLNSSSFRTCYIPTAKWAHKEESNWPG